jgi:D-sedoheptulose 7-phosphate isomerase
MTVEELYPFLYAGATDLDAVLTEVAESTRTKAAEVTALREQTAARYADQLAACAARLAEAFRRGGRLFTFGNGGSSTDAQSVAALFCHPGPAGTPVPAIPLTGDVALLTALSNDVGFEVVFARQLAAFAAPGDVALGLSTSGGSANVLAGFAEARRRGMLTVGFAGYDGGRMAEADSIEYLFVIPSSSVHRIQEVQTTTYHVLWELTQQALAG